MSSIPQGLWKKVSSNKSSSQANKSIDSKKLNIFEGSKKCNNKLSVNRQNSIHQSQYVASVQNHFISQDNQKQKRKYRFSYQFQQSVDLTSQKSLPRPVTQNKEAFQYQQNLFVQKNESIVEEQIDINKITNKKHNYYLNPYQSFGVNLNITSKKNKTQTLENKKFENRNKKALIIALQQIRSLKNYCMQLQDLHYNFLKQFQDSLKKIKLQFDQKIHLMNINQNQRNQNQKMKLQIKLFEKQNIEIWKRYEELTKENQQLKSKMKQNQQNKFQQKRDEQIRLRRLNIQLQQKYNHLFQQNQILEKQKNVINRQMLLLNQKIRRLQNQINEKITNQNNLNLKNQNLEILCDNLNSKVKDLQCCLEKTQEVIRNLQFSFNRKSSGNHFQFNNKLPIELRMEQSYQIPKFNQNFTQPQRQKSIQINKNKINKYPNSFIEQRLNKKKISQQDRPINQKGMIKLNPSTQDLLLRRRSSSQTLKGIFETGKQSTFHKSQFPIKQLKANLVKVANSRDFGQQNNKTKNLKNINQNLDRLKFNLKAQLNALK